MSCNSETHLIKIRRKIFTSDQLDQIVQKLGGSLSEQKTIEKSPELNLSDPINLSSSQSSSIIKNIMKGKSSKSVIFAADYCELSSIERNKQLLRRKIKALQDLRLEKRNWIQKKTEILDNLIKKRKFNSANPSVRDGKNLVQDSSDAASISSKISDKIFSPDAVSIPPKPPEREIMKPTGINPFNEEFSLPKRINELLHTSYEMQPPIFRFDASQEAASFNFELLKKE